MTDHGIGIDVEIDQYLKPSEPEYYAALLGMRAFDERIAELWLWEGAS